MVQTETGFKPIEQIRVGDLVYAKEEATGKTEYHRVVQLFQRQANETYHITVKGIPITTTGEHPFWVHGQGWVEARDLKVGDLLQSPEGKPYPIDRIEMMNNSTSAYNFEVEGVHNYFVTESEIWTHNVIGSIVKAILQVFTKNAAKSAAKNVVKSAAKSAGKASKGTGKGKTFVDKMNPSEAARYQRYWKQDYNPNYRGAPNTRERTYTTPGTRSITDRKLSRTGEMYERETIYDRFGRRIGNNDYTYHGKPHHHGNPHYHPNPWQNPTQHGPNTPGLHPNTPRW